MVREVHLFELDKINTLHNPVYIYGAGAAARSLANTIKDESGLTIKSFITTEESGNLVDGIPVNTIDEIWNEINQVGVTLIVTNQYSREIINTLLSKNIHFTLLDGIHYVFPTYQFLPEQLDSEQVKDVEFIINNLGSERSKRIYKNLLVLRQMVPADCSYQEIFNAFYSLMNDEYGYGSECYYSQYLEYHQFTSMTNIVEGGTSNGQISSLLVQYLSRDGALHSFDPQIKLMLDLDNKSNYPSALLEADSNGQFVVVDAALWHESGTKKFNMTGDTTGSISEAGEEVQVTSLDDYCHQHRIDKLDFIKLDIEGAEPNCIEGAYKVLTTLKPAFSISIYHGNEQIISIPKQLMKLLPGYSFEVGHHSNSPFLETVLYGIPG